MTHCLRWIKIGMVAAIALFFSLVAWNNLIDFHSNWLFVQHVLSMDTTFHQPALMGRAITNAAVQQGAYYLIMVWEMITAIICWIGCFILIFKVHSKNSLFNEAKKIAFIGLFFGFLLYVVGFIVIGGEWFSMWQSANWNGQMKAGLFGGMIMFVMIFLHNNEHE